MKAIILCLLASLVCGGAARAGDLLIRDVAIVSPHLDDTLGDRDVLIRAGRIAAVSAEPLDNPDEVREIDGAGLFLTPGLTDSHVHTFSVPGFPLSAPSTAGSLGPLKAVYYRQQPKSYLYFGVTQLVDLAASPALLGRFEANAVRPRLFHCGAAPLAAGYPIMFMRGASLEAVFPYYVAGPSGDDPSDHAERRRHTPEAVVRRMHDDGAVCVKLFMEDGFGENASWPVLDDDSMRRVIDAARARDMRVVVHANALDMQAKALEFDIDVIAHGLWNWGKHRGAKTLPPALQRHLDAIHARGIHFQPTFGVMNGLRALFDETLIDEVKLAAVAPRELRDWYATPEGRWFREELIRDEGWQDTPNEVVAEVFASGVDRGAQAVAYLDRLGHPLLLGSDTPSSPTFANQPGLNTFLELKAMHDAGLDLRAVFEAATLNNALAFGIERDHGSVEVGKVANLLLLEASPLDSIDAYDAIRHVIVDGVAHARGTLAADRD